MTTTSCSRHRSERQPMPLTCNVPPQGGRSGEIADVGYDGGPVDPETGYTIDPLDGPDLPHFGESPSGISDDQTQESVSWSDSYKGYFGDVTGRPMTPE